MAKQIMDTKTSPLFTELTAEEAANVNGGNYFPLLDWGGYLFPFFFPEPQLTPGSDFERSLFKQNIYRMNQDYFS